MNTPICDFVQAYREKKMLRCHMPGHKGKPVLGVEPLDLTEIYGADSLYEAEGIIRESEENAASLFGCPTFYSAEGSTQCIKAMVYLAVQWAKMQGKKPRILAGRNAHKAFVTAAALMDLEVTWLFPGDGENYLSCCPKAENVESVLQKEKPAALYLTSPDYLGHMADIEKIAAVCRKQNVLLIVDNAHGAYLKFLEKSLHPMDLGADFCCDSAHKTLPVLTGGAYLHLSEQMMRCFSRQLVKKAMSFFGSTSPSYLILQSLDAANPYLASDFRDVLRSRTEKLAALKKRMTAEKGYQLTGDEPLKLTIQAKPYGYTGYEMAQALREKGVECEFCDPDHLVLMPGAEMDEDEEERLSKALLTLEKRPEIRVAAPAFAQPAQGMGIREAVMAESEMLPCERCLGRILAGVTVGCPPAVPILVSGEKIDEKVLRCFQYYGIAYCDVVKNG